jgi:uncharacterized membrane protein YgaE (UPF0421/DUF939 family)
VKIGIRTFKTAVGSGLAMYIAHLLGLNFYGSAAILTILCMETTKMRSLKTSFNRSAACVVGLVIGGLFFEIVGYSPLTFAVFILLFLPLLIQLKIKDGFITSIVIILHIYTLGKINDAIIINELKLILVGSGVALILNSFMPRLDKELGIYQEKIEASFKKILSEYANYLEKGDQGWDGKELLEMEISFNYAKSLAIRKVENHLLRKADRQYNYFEMREKQFEILQRMLPSLSALDENVPQRLTFSLFLRELGENVKEENTAYIFIERLSRIRLEMENLPLPTTRKEFETRADVFYLMKEMERYLIIKQKANLTQFEPRKKRKRLLS